MTSTLASPAEEERIATTGGLQLFVRSWRPAVPARAVVAIVHGVKSHSGYYAWAGEQLAAAGLAVYALDLRGRGRSDGPRLYVDDIAEYTADVDALLKHARTREPGLPVFLLGHSAGGVVSSVYTLDHQAELAGLICESFAFRVYAPSFALTLLGWISRIAPRLPVLRLPTAGFSRDPSVVQAMIDDPLGVHHEAQPAATVAALVRAGERLEREFPRVTLPVLILHGTADRVTRPDGSQEFHARAGSADKTLKLYDGHVHDLLSDVGRETVMDDILRWIDAHLATV
ncbi:lysophospholipase [Longimicrobium sp.]|uniref:alpha/beta hydrolase n=1 Tax=Longimicrobium sp. TaxID=2029185 RepID=UPI002E37445E|nr:lysophospholipase [Longimicrobium sp.]HEX6040133.1 alpha/beta hydrolase [Longimicrobium sp.]